MFHDFGKFILDGGVAVYGMLLLAAFGVAVTWERCKALYFDYGRYLLMSSSTPGGSASLSASRTCSSVMASLLLFQ